MRKLSGSSYSLIVVIVMMLIIMSLSLGLQYFATKLLPLLIGSMVLILAVIALARDMKAGHSLKVTTAATETDAAGKTSVEASQYLRIAAWILGFSVAIYVVGFLIAIALFVGAYIKRHASNWPATIITAVIFTGIIHIVFNFALKADLYKGQLLMWLGF
ncbi:MAG: hypothetical protein A2169_08420 [Deltaproteobacteria bacterium RBG_13_47_9]|nr:MAG: hypothetical protein A2169_08420 [Deltaproteobacteria bacterium RBG_13_47_9]